MVWEDSIEVIKGDVTEAQKKDVLTIATYEYVATLQHMLRMSASVTYE